MMSESSSYPVQHCWRCCLHNRNRVCVLTLQSLGLKNWDMKSRIMATSCSGLLCVIVVFKGHHCIFIQDSALNLFVTEPVRASQLTWNSFSRPLWISSNDSAPLGWDYPTVDVVGSLTWVHFSWGCGDPPQILVWVLRKDSVLSCHYY